MHSQFAQTAALFSDPSRTSMLMSLLEGIALPAGQLAMAANVSPQTASSHLARLVDGRLLKVEQQGRHRYYRLANREVAHVIEAMMALGARGKNTSRQAIGASQVPEMLAYARTCYSHLAGRLAVQIAEEFEKRELLVRDHLGGYSLTRQGQSWFEELGIVIPHSRLRKSCFARPCLDWSERRHHIAGELGSIMLARFRELRWIAPVRLTRAVRVTLEGRRQFRTVLDIRC